jgi:DNA-binding FrmR family transcriptional regulator
VINPYTVYLAQIVTNKEIVLSTTSMDAEFKNLEKERTRLNEELGACFKKGSTQSVTTVGKVVDRNTDWNNVFTICEHISTAINKVDRHVLQKKIDECNTHLGLILKMLDSDQVDKVANQTVQNLANGAYQVASELEFFAVVYFKSEVLLNAVNRTVENFRQVTKGS